MSSQFVLPKVSEEAALDYQQLYALGLEHVQGLARQIWTDYNIHDPGITTLELLCYALTDLSYRATSPIQDLLAGDNPTEIKEQFFTACQIFPNRPLTLLDYRKLLIDIEGVENAWLQPATQIYYADPVKGKLFLEKPPDISDVKDINIHGLYDVLIEYRSDLNEEGKKNIETVVKEQLQANRNLCEDFVNFQELETQEFILCGELEVIPNADVEKVKAEILFKIQQYLSPAIRRYSLSEMLARKAADEIFEGPVLAHGFIDDDELEQAELRETIFLSDVINLIMDIEAVQAVKDIIIHPMSLSKPLANKWVVPISDDPNNHKFPTKALINRKQSNLIFHKHNRLVVPYDNKVEEYYQQLVAIQPVPPEPNDLEVPLGKSRQIDTYYSFQNHFPTVYGLSEIGLDSPANEHRQALAYQLKAYLLFFDQIMANYLAQLNQVKALFSTDPNIKQTYFYQIVDSFTDAEKIYNTTDIRAMLQSQGDENHIDIDRRHRFLDHLIARFAEKFHDLAYTLFKPDEAIQRKCEFLDHYPTLSSRRLLAYNYTPINNKGLWNSKNVSGLEKRLASLLGIEDYTRRDLSGEEEEEGMYLIENILLRPEQDNDPFLPIRPNPNYTTDYPEFDPYSYRIHIILPAYADRFSDMNFRRFAEEVIREETPAHILPKICWISREDMVELQEYYREWLELKASKPTEQRQEILTNFINKLFALRNSYPSQPLHECDGDNKQFILGQTRLGTEKGE